MALTCPRCGIDVSNEALYCPYCSLPKPKRGFAEAAEEQADEISLPEQPRPSVAPRKPLVAPRKPSVSLKPPRQEVPPRRTKRPTARPEKPPRRLRLSVLSVAALVAVFSAGIYIFVVPLVYSEQAEPKVVWSALDKLRHLPSNEADLTIDARLLRELETSRRVGNLATYQGWTVRHIKGTKSKVVLVFSYEEVGGVHQSAEWIADLNNNIFTPQTELAVAVHGKQ